MLRKIVLIVLFGLFLFHCPEIFAVDPETIAAFTGDLTFSYPQVSGGSAYARAFDAAGSPTITEVQLPLAIYTQESVDPCISVNVVVELRPDSNGQPSSTEISALWSRQIGDLPYNGIDNPRWISFKPATGVIITPGKYWIVCKLTPLSTTASILWYCPSGNNNLYGNWYDNKTRTTGGVSWDLAMYEFYFKVLGARAPKQTITTVTADPNVVQVSCKSVIKVTVTDAGSNPASGYVTLSATGGTLDSNVLTLNSFGQGSTKWTAPGSLSTQTITATFPPGQGSGGFDYNNSNASTNINVNLFTGARDTNTIMSLSKYTVKTHEDITISVSVVDKSAMPVIVNNGKVSFFCSDGKFASPNPVSVVNGACSTTWTSPDVEGPFTILAEYSGWNVGTYKFKASLDSNDVMVQYRDFATATTITISPTFPYISKSTYVSVEVTDTTTGNRVPGGKVLFSSIPGSAPAGWFDPIEVNVTTGRDYTKWNAPASDGDATIIAIYQPGPPYIAAGCRYFTSTDSEAVTVVKDCDSSDASLMGMIEWVADYSSYPPNKSIDSTKDSSEGFAAELNSVCGWGGWNFGNASARAADLRHRWYAPPLKAGREDDFMDSVDFTWYNGHGSPGEISFTHPWSFPYYDRSFESYEATNVLTEPQWGNKDAEWIAMKSCTVLSVPDKWAGTMDGLHLICGFHTNSLGCGRFGPLFAGFMMKKDVYDEPHTIVQSWFLTADMTQPNYVRQRVVGETVDSLNDYLWGQGPVSQDIVVDGAVTMEHDVNNHTPDANAGGPYTVVAGQPLTLDASGTTDADPNGTITYIWDMNITSNTDSNDYDGDDSDESDDDCDVRGRSGSHPAKYVFNTTGIFTIRLMVYDDTFNHDNNTATVTVTSPPLPPAPPPGGSAGETSEAPPAAGDGGPGGLEIIDNFDPMTLPTDVQLPVFRMTTTDPGYMEMLNIAGYYGMTAGYAGLDSVDNWTLVENGRELIINQHTGSVMYVDKNWAYIYPGYPPILPPEPTAIAIANNWLAANGIPTMEVVLDGVSDISYGVITENSHHYVSKTPFQRRVNYRRIMNVNGTNYPVVGPGGKITVMMDDTYDIRMFVKIKRELFQAEIVALLPSNLAVQQFHNLGVRALMKESQIPFNCTTVEIDNVTLGYYEEDFVTEQNNVTPVYILDLTCLDEKSSQKTQVYISAMTEPLHIDISDPCGGIEVDYGEEVNFTCTAIGGTPPYSYRWSSDVDGLLSTESTFATTSLSARQLVESCTCEKLPHSISITVTDFYGLEATEFVDVTVLAYCSDFDGNGIVDFKDFADLALAWLAGAGESNYDEKTDLLTDGVVNLEDLCVLTGEWLQ